MERHSLISRARRAAHKGPANVAACDMPLTFDACVALSFSALLAVLALIYVGFFEPATKFMPQRARFAARRYFVRLIQLGAQSVIHRSFTLTTKGPLEPEAALFLVNHATPLDYFLILALAKEKKVEHVFFYVYGQCVRLPNLKSLLKAQRSQGNWSIAASQVASRFAEFYSVNSRHTRWVVMFPEVEMYSIERARENTALCYSAGAPMLERLLYPRYASVIQGIDILRASVTAVYVLGIKYKPTNSPEIVPAGTPPAVPGIDALATELGWTAQLSARRFAVSKIPRSPKKVEKWIEKAWFKLDAELKRA